ncbi:MAG: hypothetical protein WCF38_17420, partial [Pseudolabrys sp.]
MQVPPAFQKKQIVCIAKSRALYRKKSTSWDAMSAIGAKRTSACALHMSAFRGKADVTVCAAHVRL